MRARLAPLALALALSLPATAGAQDRDELQIWTALIATQTTQPAPPDLTLWLDMHARRGGAGTVVIVRPGVGVRVLDWLSLWAGYGWIPVFTDATGAVVHEHRTWQQVTLGHRLAEVGLSFQSRTRFEQRFSEAGGDVGLRLREFVRVNWQPFADLPIGVAFWDELFIGLTETDWAPAPGVDQNRVFLGPFLAMAEGIRLEAGYLFTYLDRGTSDLYAHVVAVNLFLSLRPPPAPPAEGEGEG